MMLPEGMIAVVKTEDEVALAMEGHVVLCHLAILPPTFVQQHDILAFECVSSSKSGGKLSRWKSGRGLLFGERLPRPPTQVVRLPSP